MKNLIRIFAIVFIAIGVAAADRIPCAKRYFPNQPFSNSFACVCNATYCDTFEQVDMQDKDTHFQEFITCRNGYRMDKFKTSFEHAPTKDSRLNITINRRASFQKIMGFGGAITDAAGFNIYSLSEKNVENIVNSYYAKTGNEYNIMRVPVGGVDFSTRTYTYNDLVDDFNLTSFALEMEDLKWKIPFIQAALEAKEDHDIKLFASAWTAPPWMKTNNDYVGNGTLKGEPGGLYYQIWANYYLKFFQTYKNDHNLSFWAMTAQNEPSDGNIYKFFFNAMGFTPYTQAVFVTDNLGPTLEKNGFGDIKIMILDDQRLFLPMWPQSVLKYKPETSKYVAGIAVHWYMDMLVTPKLLDETHALIPDKFIFATEACAGAEPFLPHVILGGFDRAEEYAKYIIQDLQHWVTGWTDWNLALDMKGGPNWANNFVDSPIIVNAEHDEFYKQPMFYALAHFSKFLLVDSVRIDTQHRSSLGKLQHSYVVFNHEETRQTIMIILNQSNEDFAYSVFDPDTKDYINGISGAHSIKTIVWFY